MNFFSIESEIDSSLKMKDIKNAVIWLTLISLINSAITKKQLEQSAKAVEIIYTQASNEEFKYFS